MTALRAGARTATHLVGLVHGELPAAEDEPPFLPGLAALALLHEVPALEGDVLAQASAVATVPNGVERCRLWSRRSLLLLLLLLLSGRRLLLLLHGQHRPLVRKSEPWGPRPTAREAGRVGLGVAAGPVRVLGFRDGREGDARALFRRGVLVFGAVGSTRQNRGV